MYLKYETPLVFGGGGGEKKETKKTDDEQITLALNAQKIYLVW